MIEDERKIPQFVDENRENESQIPQYENVYFAGVQREFQSNVTHEEILDAKRNLRKTLTTFKNRDDEELSDDVFNEISSTSTEQGGNALYN